MSKFKAQNKSKIQMPKSKTEVLSFDICAWDLFWILGFVICHCPFALLRTFCEFSGVSMAFQ
jgi:hypothetical protein